MRQRYAQLVGDDLQEISNARKLNNYPTYYESLVDLRVDINHKFKPGDVDKYTAHMKRIAELANKYPETWRGTRKDPQETSLIKSALNDCEIFLKQCMENADMFGSKYSENEDEL